MNHPSIESCILYIIRGKCEISAFFPGSRHRCGSAISQLRSPPNCITGRDQCSVQSNAVRSVLLPLPCRDRLISEVRAIRSMRFQFSTATSETFEMILRDQPNRATFIMKSVHLCVYIPNKVHSSVETVRSVR